MRKLPALSLIVLIATTACATSTSSSSTTTSRSAEVCIEPPADQLDFESNFELTLDPNRVHAGSEATLSTDMVDASTDYIGGAGASWECWNGTEWMPTHIVVRAFNESSPAGVIDLAEDTNYGVPDIGLTLPNSFTILIPDVTPGKYRITDQLYGGPEQLVAHVIVEVSG